MKILAALFEEPIGWIILVLGIITLIGYIAVYSRTNRLEGTINQNKKKTKKRHVYNGNGYTTEPDVNNWEDVSEYMKDFNNIQVSYKIVAQLVPVFPLLGLLGTVWGLMKEISGMTEVAAGQPIDTSLLISGLSTAMVTTFAGLVMAIAFKIIDSLLVSKKMYRMELFFDTFEREYQVAKDKYIINDKTDDK